jgi:hypothetical protein
VVDELAGDLEALGPAELAERQELRLRVLVFVLSTYSSLNSHTHLIIVLSSRTLTDIIPAQG